MYKLSTVIFQTKILWFLRNKSIQIKKTLQTKIFHFNSRKITSPHIHNNWHEKSLFWLQTNWYRQSKNDNYVISKRNIIAIDRCVFLYFIEIFLWIFRNAISDCSLPFPAPCAISMWIFNIEYRELLFSTFPIHREMLIQCCTFG